MMKKMEAINQSPVSTNTNRPVPTTPMPTNTDRNFFLPRMMSETVPKMGEMMATINTEMERVMLQYWVAVAALGKLAPATLL